jgi:hypothetical protein
VLGFRLDCWRDGVSILAVRYLHMYEYGGTLNGGFSFPAAAIGLGVDVGAINVSSQGMLVSPFDRSRREQGMLCRLQKMASSASARLGCRGAFTAP